MVPSILHILYVSFLLYISVYNILYMEDWKTSYTKVLSSKYLPKLLREVGTRTPVQQDQM